MDAGAWIAYLPSVRVSALLAISTLATWFLGAATLVLGSLLTIAGEVIRHRFAVRDAERAVTLAAATERQKRVEERAEAAATDAMEVLDELLDLVRSSSPDDGPDHASLSPLASNLRRDSVYLPDAASRRAMSIVVEVFEQPFAIRSMLGERPRTATYKAAGEARRVLGSVLRGQPPPGRSDLLEGYHAAVLDNYQAEDTFEEP